MVHASFVYEPAFLHLLDFEAFMGPVINKNAFDKILNYIKHAKDSKKASIIAGGHFDASRGYFIQPTVILTADPSFKTLKEEIFGPVLTVFLYPDAEYENALKDIDASSSYALTASL